MSPFAQRLCMTAEDWQKIVKKGFWYATGNGLEHRDGRKYKRKNCDYGRGITVARKYVAGYYGDMAIVDVAQRERVDYARLRSGISEVRRGADKKRRVAA